MKIPHLFRQYIWLIDTIYRHKALNLEEINERWMRTEMSGGTPLARTTFNRHRDAIQDMFDITIECDRRNSNRYYIEDASTINMKGVKKWMLDTISVGSIMTESMHMRDRILLENIPSGNGFLPTLTLAIKNEKKVILTYQKFGCEPYKIEVEPYCLKLYHQRWYVLVHLEKKGYLVIYSLDRILDIEETNEGFKIDKNFDAEEYFKPYYGVIVGEANVQKIVIRTDHVLANYYRTLPLHHTQKETATTDDYVEFTMHLSPSFDFRQEILSQGDSIEVIEPASLREQIASMLEKTLKKYR